MFIVKDGYIYVGVSLLLAAIVYYFFGAVWAVIPVVLALYFAYFFRDFHRVTPYDPNILYSPADGTVMGVDEIFDDEYLNEPATKVTIFLSVFNVHTNRAPLDGEIKYQRYTCGQFVPAYEKNASFENERHAIGMDAGTPHRFMGNCRHQAPTGRNLRHDQIRLQHGAGCAQKC